MFTVVPVLGFAICYGRYEKNCKKYQESLAKAGEIATEHYQYVENSPVKIWNMVDILMQLWIRGRARAFVYGSFAGAMGLLSYTAITTVLWYGGTLVIRGEMKPGTLISFLLYTIFIASALGALTSVFGQLMTAVGSS